VRLLPESISFTAQIFTTIVVSNHPPRALMHEGISLEGLCSQTVPTHGNCHKAEVSLDIPVISNKYKESVVCKSERNGTLERLGGGRGFSCKFGIDLKVAFIQLSFPTWKESTVITTLTLL
jgi:hypothetical protein